MPSEREKADALCIVIEHWLPYLFPSQFRAVTYMVQQGFTGERWMGPADRAAMEEALQSAPKTLSDVFRGLVQIGAIEKKREGSASLMRVDLSWRPKP